MLITHWLVNAAALATWYGFASRMRRAFRHANRWTLAKTVLVASGWICTIVQFWALLWYGPVTWWSATVAVAIYATAYALFRSALRTHGRAKPAFVFTETAPNSFCTTGPYRYIRHPLYAAYLLAWLAPPLATAQWWLLIPTAWMTMLYTIAAWQEERAFAHSPFAADYQRYRQQAGMFWPSPFMLLSDLRKSWPISQRNANSPSQDPRLTSPNHPVSDSAVAQSHTLPENRTATQKTKAA